MEGAQKTTTKGTLQNTIPLYLIHYSFLFTTCPFSPCFSFSFFVEPTPHTLSSLVLWGREAK